ncbi:MAG: pyruvate kinase [Clostridia bacterium]|nr:pyruvate kinase [Clostridia bacterium]
MRKTKIICTLGPAVDDEGTIKELILSGLDAARFNFSHGNYEQHTERLNRFRKVENELGYKIPCILDTKGPEIRLGVFDEPVTLKVGDEYVLTTEEVNGNSERASISYKGLPSDLEVGSKVLIDDGLVELEVLSTSNQEIRCKVLNQGTISSNKGVNVPGTKTSLPSLTEKDVNDLKYGADNNFDYVAASFIRSKEDILIIKKYLENFGKPQIKVIAKIENQEGIDNFDDILSVSDGIMVARGDLGIELPAEKIPTMQKMMIRKTLKAGKIVITATQMLDSMIKNPRPTRAEVSDVANAIHDGTTAIMLSGETASGAYPVEAVKTMAKIAEEAESNIDYGNLRNTPENILEADLNDKDIYRECINFSVYVSAKILQAKAILCVSEEGKSPKVLSKFRPSCPVFAITPNEKCAKQLSLEWGIKVAYVPDVDGFDERLNAGIEKFKMMGLLEKGDTVILSGGATHAEDSLNKQMLGGILKV